MTGLVHLSRILKCTFMTTRCLLSVRRRLLFTLNSTKLGRKRDILIPITLKRPLLSLWGFCRADQKKMAVQTSDKLIHFRLLL